ncbi:MAG TPA: hypothetical protein VEQ63_01735 [Bryobacteraceae bacterium]|nr:hypothetical protein [Bryobacteraceae bacterium]
MIQNNAPLDEPQFPTALQNGLRTYAASLPDHDGGRDFMPQLWGKIDARRRVAYSFRRLTGLFVTAAAAICIVFSAALVQHQGQQQSASTQVELQSSYVDVLADDAADEMEMVVSDRSETI